MHPVLKDVPYKVKEQKAIFAHKNDTGTTSRINWKWFFEIVYFLWFFMTMFSNFWQTFYLIPQESQFFLKIRIDKNNCKYN